MAMRWSPEEDELLLKLRREGFTAKEMAAHLRDRTHAAIRARLGVIAPDNLNRKWTEEEKELVFQMKAEGKSNKQIARATGRTLGAVASFVSRNWHGTSKANLNDL
jgi:DNA-binding NarL/FixJ family response regulator